MNNQNNQNFGAPPQSLPPPSTGQLPLARPPGVGVRPSPPMSGANIVRPPIPAGPSNARPPVPVSPSTARPPMPMAPRPPMPINGSPAAANTMAPRPPMTARPPIPMSTARPNFARPPVASVQNGTPVMQRPPMPLPGQLPIQRPAMPLPGQLPIQRPPMPMPGSSGPRPLMPSAPGPRPQMSPSGAPVASFVPGMTQVQPRPSPPLMPRPPQASPAVSTLSAGKPSPFAQVPPGSTHPAPVPALPAMGMRPPMPQAPLAMRPPPPRPMAPISPAMRPPPLATAPMTSMAPPVMASAVPAPPMAVAPFMGSPTMNTPAATMASPNAQRAPVPSAFSHPASPMKTSAPVRPPMPFASQVPSLQQSPTKSPQLRPLPPMMMTNGQIGQYPQAQQIQQGQQVPQGQYPQQAQVQPLQPGQYPQQQPGQYPQQAQVQPLQPGQYPQQQPGQYPQQQPGYPQHAQQGQFQQAPPQQRVNPAAIPSVVSVLEADRERFKDFGPYLTYTHVAEHPPPLPATTAQISVLDDGNSAPNFIRATMNHVPATEELCENSKIPLALLFQPFASSTEPVPVADLGELGPVRCNRCRAYINPQCQFIKGGRAFVCNLCEMTNEVPEEYYANLDMNGKRIDLDLRPELRYGTVDFVATKDYISKTPGKPFLLFGIDTSKGALSSGATVAALDAITGFLQQERECELYGGVGLMLFDRCITFYTLKSGSTSAEAIVMGDIVDPFLPVHHERLFVPLSAGVGLIHQLKASLLASAAGSDASPLCCFGSAVQCAIDAVQGRGGRCLFFLTALPSAGLGALKNRSADPQMNPAAAPTDKAPPLLIPQSDFYSRAGKRAAEAGVSLSLCVAPAGYCDLSTIGGCSEYSGGSVFYGPTQGRALYTHVCTWLNSSFAFDCLARIRCGSGLQVKKHYGHFNPGSNGHDLAFGCLDADGSAAAWMEYDGKLSEITRIGFQVACLYTHALTGQRRIRVLNLALPVTTAMPSIFRMAELDAILAFYVKKNISQRLEAPVAAFPASLTAKCVAILAAYRRYCAANMSAGQLILPDSLKLLPIITLAAIKNSAFHTLPLSPDVRAQASLHLMSFSLTHYLEHFYPRLYPMADGSSHDVSALPACLRLSREHLTREGIYLLCNGHEIILYIGDGVPAPLLQDIFAQSLLNACHLQPDSQLPVLSNPTSARLREAINALRSLAACPMPLRLIRQSVDVAEEAEWSHWMVEDSLPTGPSYVDYLCRVHAQIQQLIAQGTTLSLAERTSMLNFFH